MERKPVRFLTLDAMRGIAAILVVLYHFRYVATLASSGYLAVDFFFLLSGLVIAKTYTAKFASGLSVQMFMIQRFIRLYPIFAIGMAIGIARMAGQLATGLPGQSSIPELLTSSVLGLLLLPNAFSGGLLFPANAPAWSLFLEMVANLFYAALILRASSRQLFACVLSLAGLMLWMIANNGHADGGQSWESIHFGFIRVTFSFTLGCAFSKLIDTKTPIESKWSLLVAALLCCVLIGAPSIAFRPYYDTLVVLVIWPSIVWVAARINPPKILEKTASILGDISYPMYIIHYALLWMASFVARKLNIPTFGLIVGFLVGVFILSYWIATYYDPAARRIMGAALGIGGKPAKKPLNISAG